MPSREEEFQAGKKEPRGEPVCPYCGRGEYLYKSRRQPGWWGCGNERCAMYGKAFPTPSYGPRGKPSWLDRLLRRGR